MGKVQLNNHGFEKQGIIIRLRLPSLAALRRRLPRVTLFLPDGLLDNQQAASYAAVKGFAAGRRMEQSDKDLLLACRRGDEAAWETLVKRYERLIYTIPRRAGLDPDRSTEVFQEVFTTLVEKLNDIEQPERLQAWLVTTARRKTLRLISREGRPRAFVDEEGEGEAEINELPDEALLPDEVLVRLEEQHRVRSALAALDERCRKLLKLLFYTAEPPPYSEIATTLGTTEGSIGPTRARCLEKLFRVLDK